MVFNAPPGVLKIKCQCSPFSSQWEICPSAETRDAVKGPSRQQLGCRSLLVSPVHTTVHGGHRRIGSVPTSFRPYIAGTPLRSGTTSSPSGCRLYSRVGPTCSAHTKKGSPSNASGLPVRLRCYGYAARVSMAVLKSHLTFAGCGRPGTVATRIRYPTNGVCARRLKAIGDRFSSSREKTISRDSGSESTLR